MKIATSVIASERIIKRWAMVVSDGFSEEFYKSYSLFKHGSKAQARKLGMGLGAICDFPYGSTLSVFSSPYNNIPKAANALKNYLLLSCAKQFEDREITIKQSKVFREYAYEEDYGKMTAEERNEATLADIMTIDKSAVEKDDILVFVDDVKITGGHERRILEMLDKEGIENEVIFIYLAIYVGSNPVVEDRLNHHSIEGLQTIEKIIKEDQVIFNTRLIKYILNSEKEEFQKFISSQSISFLESLYGLSILCGYQKKKIYEKNMKILRNFMG